MPPSLSIFRVRSGETDGNGTGWSRHVVSMNLTFANFHADEKTEKCVSNDGDKRIYRFRKEGSEHKMIRGIAGSFVVMLLVKSQISPTRHQAHTEQPKGMSLNVKLKS